MAEPIYVFYYIPIGILEKRKMLFKTIIERYLNFKVNNIDLLLEEIKKLEKHQDIKESKAINIDLKEWNDAPVIRRAGNCVELTILSDCEKGYHCELDDFMKESKIPFDSQCLWDEYDFPTIQFYRPETDFFTSHQDCMLPEFKPTLDCRSELEPALNTNKIKEYLDSAKDADEFMRRIKDEIYKLMPEKSIQDY